MRTNEARESFHSERIVAVTGRPAKVAEYRIWSIDGGATAKLVAKEAQNHKSTTKLVTHEAKIL